MELLLHPMLDQHLRHIRPQPCAGNASFTLLVLCMSLATSIFPRTVASAQLSGMLDKLLRS